MTDRLRIALAQLNPHVGALARNLGLARAALTEALAAKADILMFSELFLTGYFPEDLLFKPRFIEDAMETAQSLAADTKNTDLSLLLPTVWREADGTLSLRLDSHRRRITVRPGPADDLVLRGWQGDDEEALQTIVARLPGGGIEVTAGAPAAAAERRLPRAG